MGNVIRSYTRALHNLLAHSKGFPQSGYLQYYRYLGTYQEYYNSTITVQDPKSRRLPSFGDGAANAWLKIPYCRSRSS